MPWKDTNIMDLRRTSIHHRLAQAQNTHGRRRPVRTVRDQPQDRGYKWIDRYLQREGPDWVLDRSHTARVIANKTPLEVEQALMHMRALHPTWGAASCCTWSALQQPASGAASRVHGRCDMLKRNGLITAKPRRRRLAIPGAPAASPAPPTTAGDGRLQGPVPAGQRSVHLPADRAPTTSAATCWSASALTRARCSCRSKEVFTRVFKDFGLPRAHQDRQRFALRCSHPGQAQPALGVVAQRLGILPELSRTRQASAKRSATSACTARSRPRQPSRPAPTSRAQQRKFNVWRREYNELSAHTTPWT